jgi:hypothetical protein
MKTLSWLKSYLSRQPLEPPAPEEAEPVADAPAPDPGSPQDLHRRFVTVKSGERRLRRTLAARRRAAEREWRERDENQWAKIDLVKEPHLIDTFREKQAL